jgi:nucleotidyltransferase/DNA polymerase involved in DNA repair
MDIAPMPRLARVPADHVPKISAEEASDLLRGLKQPVTVLRGVGPGMAKMLEKVGHQHCRRHALLPAAPL